MAELKQEGITVKKSENFDEWYVQSIVKSGLVDYSSVSGCLVFKPSGYAIWEIIQKNTDAEFKKIGIQNVYFPIFIPERLLKKEKEHVKGFSPEVAWVTHAGDSKLEERLAVRPTSETIMYESYSKWIRSWRDLPLRLNQWNNVVRWEFKHPIPLLRTREFLWNEGHTVFATKEEAEAERDEILEIYKKITEEYLALPGIIGRKTDAEKFAGAVATYSIEHLLPDGKAVQGPDFHNDGQNFSKVFDINFLDKGGKGQYAWQNTWAISTREIGVMAATHGDDKGLVLPPRVAPIQIVIIPIIFKDVNKKEVLSKAKKIKISLEESGFRVFLDVREEYTAGWKFNEWELKGVPLRLEIGPKDIEKKQVVLVRRDNSEKLMIKETAVVKKVLEMLDSIQENMYKKAKKFLSDNISIVKTYEELKNILKNKKGFIKASWCGDHHCENQVKLETGATIRVIPFEKEKATKCVYCNKAGKEVVYFAKAY